MNVVGYSRRGAVVLTRPRVRVISSTKWEVNMTKKYRVESSAIAPRMVGIIADDFFDFIAKKTINENARKSGACISSDGSVKMNIV